MKKFLIVAICMVMAFGAYLSMGTVDNTPVSAPDAVAKAKSFSGTMYVAGHGGHFAKADITVDGKGIKLNKLDMISIGSGKGYFTHDARIDSEDNTKLFWSTYKPDPKNNGASHVGVSDLKTGKVIKDLVHPLDKGAKFTGALYCGSGQSKKNFMPMTMTKVGYIDVFDKATLKHKHRVYAEDLGFDQNYIFMHGNSSPDLKTMMVTLNGSEKWSDPSKPEFNKRTGVIHNLLLDTAALDNGKVKILKKNTVTGSKTKTFTFRQTFTPDGKLVLQSGADRAYILDAKSLKLKKEVMMKDGENHDVVAGPNNKYGVLTLRTKTKKGGKTTVDGALQLLNLKTGKTVGKPVSVCNACHKKDLGEDVAKAVLCGADVNWK
jgi:hypothetical protein